ncbi:MAG: NAD-dependent formate dehydrogenase [Rubrobacter sp.]|nr:NAD-dependent formate dehydrogenase [Rubrobacter sp.]
MKIVAVLYPGGSAADNPEVLGCAENALGLREPLEEDGHELISTTEREGEELLGHLRDADVLITTPFWPVYVTKEMLGEASDLKLILTAGVGSDHVDLGEAAERGITVAEITGSNTVSVAEHAAMQILVLVRNFVPAYNDIVEGGWSIGEIAAGSHDLEGKVVGIYGAGQIGQLIAARLKPFDVKMLYYKRSRLGTVEELSLGIRYATLKEMAAECDVIVIASPLTPETEGLFDRETLFAMKRGAYLVNIARGAIVETDALVEALEEGHLGGYAGDVWYPEPAPSDHPWRHMPRHAMTPHVSGTTLEAQRRYASGVRDSLMSFLDGEPIRDDYVMVADGEIQSGSYKAIYG